MSKSSEYIFVLWASDFEEKVAATFVAELRQAGLLVKVIGLTPGVLSGAHGLALVPDLPLSKALALAAQTSCIIIPTTPTHLAPLKNDPRLGELLERAYAHGARFVVGSPIYADKTITAVIPAPAEEITLYPEGQGLSLFVHELIGLFLEKTNS